MLNNDLFNNFCNERNIKNSTIKGYESALKKYVTFHNCSINYLINEALNDEESKISLKNRKIKGRLINYRTYLLKSKLSPKTMKTYFTRIKTFYTHFEIEIPHLPYVKYKKSYEPDYLNLPTKNHIKQALNISSTTLKAVILFMSSSGTGKAETLSLTVKQFIKGTQDYHNGGSIEDILNKLEKRKDIIPTFYLKRIKTDKFYYTFCSNEACSMIVKYLKSRENLKLEDKLFDFSKSWLLVKFQEINDTLKWGFKGKYRFFRAHTLRKFHASNIGLSAEYIDSLQGRSKNVIHETYIKINPKKLKKIYKKYMKNILIYNDDVKYKKTNNENINITINVFLSDNYINVV